MLWAVELSTEIIVLNQKAKSIISAEYEEKTHWLLGILVLRNCYRLYMFLMFVGKPIFCKRKPKKHTKTMIGTG